jgi:hypothetical protein
VCKAARWTAPTTSLRAPNVLREFLTRKITAAALLKDPLVYPLEEVA